MERIPWNESKNMVALSAAASVRVHYGQTAEKVRVFNSSVFIPAYMVVKQHLLCSAATYEKVTTSLLMEY